ncbi:30S ribosomal protein S8 [Candidatus Curtissbacteria bacterium RIFCSPLOWO2_01_FULL_39_62]|uniref:Small ribosomal subunit protein uS8 n=2 Tax=Candidatus Curtissiibacteriota TaxID=1752717 RepID=A0A1F5G7J1_9BACT|nr:MAG: 30S ribosomal protein S8 [Candidatus Curtissbacteria bacterium RIFCSPHIGHO2_01_FULL_39_57]OGD87817.1 MAG: 30S ribosomal protein S8 [Candidatus Curtissbacteria bacterium RIFCSPHIGHO2_02_FULL_40_16b]OGD90570.1 MAG: 30S ribosomal protein S8 [Candidatus Curtissbacteria bacterium RIFCSPHIGHO2_12_FULL_38_37]OGD99813.1 MAG: 30S ribosomal protein S8 [Candidatus Curtissbacteria bacterium RIFCSPLOWO2_02_FULL_40_11]OGE01081.1 MAG: 30S ribosomal protein S8 [Candidatus Curtissbacteria bacterium RIFC
MDPVANMFATIKNGYMANKNNVSVPYSKFKLEIAKVLEKQNFVGKVAQKDKKIEIDLLYENQKPKVAEIKKVSKLGLRVYSKSKHINLVKGGRGITIISTPNGVMAGSEARKKKLGGEVICQVW